METTIKFNSLHTSVLQTIDINNVKNTKYSLLVVRKHEHCLISSWVTVHGGSLSKILNQKFRSEKDNCRIEFTSMPYYQPFNIMTVSLRITYCITVSKGIDRMNLWDGYLKNVSTEHLNWNHYSKDFQAYNMLFFITFFPKCSLNA